MESIRFVINDIPFACWDWELREKNLEFLEGIDSEYFSYVANLNMIHIEDDEKKHRAALSLRLAYSHGLETLFALLCSAIQAPQCTIGWILNYRNNNLVDLVGKISRKEPILTQFKQEPISWASLAVNMHTYLPYEDDKKAWIQKGFGKLWSLFADDFVNDNAIHEYNGIKHGLRIKPGGFSLAVGHEDVPGVPARPEKMMDLGGSVFGSSYFVKEHIIPTDKSNFRPRSHSRNWSPLNIANGLVLISMSINNVISWLRFANGVPLSKCKFENPTSEDVFEEPWKENVGITHFSGDLTLNKEHITPFSRDEIIAVYVKT
jgi:hypothetical protein